MLNLQRNCPMLSSWFFHLQFLRCRITILRLLTTYTYTHIYICSLVLADSEIGTHISFFHRSNMSRFNIAIHIFLLFCVVSPSISDYPQKNPQLIPEEQLVSVTYSSHSESNNPLLLELSEPTPL